MLLMPDQYKQLSSCNYYCSNQCHVGQQYVPELKAKNLYKIVPETITSLHTMQKKKECFIGITADSHISGNELVDLVYIQEELERLSVAVESLQMWCECMLDTGVIDRTQYETLKNS